MPKKPYSIVLCALVLLVLIFSAVHPLTAYADDATPPPPDTTTDTSTTSIDPAATDSAATDPAPTDAVATDPAPTDAIATDPAPTDAVATDPAPTDAVATEAAPTDAVATDSVSTESVATDSAPTDAVATDPAPAEPVATDVAPTDELATDTATALPDGTEMVVLDATGTPVPLATQEASDIIATGDPIWCPAGEAPGGADCSPSFTHFGTSGTIDPGSLIYWLENVGGANSGTIYVASTYDATTAGDAGSSIVFDYKENALGSLVFQGGWDGNLDGLGTIVGTSTFDLGSGNFLEFWDWGGYGNTGISLTINDISISDSGGLYVGDQLNTPAANITLNNVNVSGNDTESSKYCPPISGCGASIPMGAASLWTMGDVTVNGSHFDSNDSSGAPGLIAGLQIGAHGNVTVNHVTASNNDGDGVAVYGYGLLGSPASTLIYDSIFNGNHSGDSAYGIGAYAYLTGDTTARCSQFESDNGGLWGNGAGTLTSDSNAFGGNAIFDAQATGAGSTLVEAASGCGGGGGGGDAPGGTGGGGGTTFNALVPTTGTSTNAVHVSDGQSVTLDCSLFSSSELFLANGDRVSLPCPIEGSASLKHLAQDELPGGLDLGFTAVSALRVDVTPAPQAKLTVAFMIPSDLQNASFTILHWDGSQWIDLGGVKTAEGFFETDSSLIGDFVLVTK